MVHPGGATPSDHCIDPRSQYEANCQLLMSMEYHPLSALPFESAWTPEEMAEFKEIFMSATPHAEPNLELFELKSARQIRRAPIINQLNSFGIQAPLPKRDQRPSFSLTGSSPDKPLHNNFIIRPSLVTPYPDRHLCSSPVAPLSPPENYRLKTPSNLHSPISKFSRMDGKRKFEVITSSKVFSFDDANPMPMENAVS
ncbi:hypothetical protein BDQ12DRAFT_737373 [Crucibulum laeve]|uniref:Uncharacterized protein n=1 Tax=Crucibulum laeve TaxID=68775 RepID=A0A5C3LS17_9AGAR|nr:hypothetical protein BDQ12DRAFT_737373 [Crucibulum laeve]